jgi:hypothetical protein
MNREALAILVMEKGDTPKIYTAGLIKALGQKGIMLKEKDFGLPDEIRENNSEKVYSTYREVKPHMWPAIMWYRNSPRVAETESYDSRGPRDNYITAHKSLQEQDPLLGQLGIIPKNFRRALVNLGVNECHLTPDNLLKVKKIILDASLEAYKRYESWKRRKRYRMD